MAARAEQEIRAYPRAHRAFYTVITRNDLLRSVAGRLKSRVRSAGDPLLVAEVALEDPEVAARREASLAVRLGCAPPVDGTS